MIMPGHEQWLTRDKYADMEDSFTTLKRLILQPRLHFRTPRLYADRIAEPAAVRMFNEELAMASMPVTQPMHGEIRLA